MFGSAVLHKWMSTLWKEAVAVVQEAGVSKKIIEEATSQARALLKEGRSFETASLPRGFEKELARLEVSPQRAFKMRNCSDSQGLEEGFEISFCDTWILSLYTKTVPSVT